MEQHDCTNCANWKPKAVQEPEPHPGRIYADDLCVGMVIRRHGIQHRRKLVVILGGATGYYVPGLQLLAGYEPLECSISLAGSGLKPYATSGRWHVGAWCEQVT